MLKHTIYFNEQNPHVRYMNLLQCNPGFIEGPRRIYDHQFVYVHKGRGRMEIEGKIYTALPGDLFFYGPGIVHTFYADEADPYLLSGIHFDFTDHFKALPFPVGPFQLQLFNEDKITEIVEFTDFPGFPAHMVLSANTKIREMIMDMLRDFEAGNIYSPEYVDGLLRTFLIIVARHTLLNSMDPDLKGETVNSVIRFLQDNFKENLTNESIAAEFHFHPNYLNQLMAAQTGVTLRQYLIDIRIRKALDMLLNAGLSISEVSRAVGYEDIHYFSRLFKKKTGVSPVQIKSNWNC